MNSVNQHIPEDDLALFALALMPPEEAAYARAHLKHCDACRAEVARMQGDLVTYSFTAEMQEPPAPARKRLMDAVASEKHMHTPAPAPVPVAEPILAPRASNLLDRGHRDLADDRPPTRSLGVFGWAGWALAASLAAVAGWQFYQGQYLREQIASQSSTINQVNADAARAQRVLHALTDPGALKVALHQPALGLPAPPKPEGHASYNADKGELVFLATHLLPIRADKTYELWVLPANGDAPVAAGQFKPDANGNASLVLPDIPRDVAAKGLGVTVENEGGAATPTLPIVLAGS